MSDPSNPAYYPTVPTEPGGDWGNFYSNFSSGPQPVQNDTVNRLGSLPAYRVEPLQDPYIIWDSRDFAAGDTILVNQGTAGEIFDLKMGGSFNEDTAPFSTMWPYSYLYGYKTLNWDNSYGTTPAAPGGFPTNISQIGGDCCDGAFTAVFAISPRYRPRQEIEDAQTASGSNSPDGYMYIECEWLSNTDNVDGGGFGIRQNLIGDNDDEPYESDLFWEWYDNTNYSQWLQQSPSPSFDPWPAGGEPVSGKLLTFTVDPWAGTTWVWYDNTPVKVFDAWGDYELPGFESAQMQFFDWINNCLKNNQSLDPTGFHELFMYFYGHEGGWLYKDNTAWNSIVGAAFFRGRPTSTDRLYWKEYFLPEGQGYQPFGLQYRVVRPGTLAHTAAHTESWVVPTNVTDPENGSYPITHLMLNTVPSIGGGGAFFSSLAYWAVMPVNGGDTITVELGGAGANPRTTGLGGWPDGGNGGLSAASGQYGGSGGGSTKIYKNGVLMIHMPGSGGSPASVPTGSAGGNQAGIRVSLPLTEGFNAPNGFPDSVYLGDGGTTIAAGAGGTGGGGNGSGSNGGTGTTSSLAVWTGGGGGGGGVFGGGGGGFDGNLSYGGAAGSWYFHPSIDIYDRTSFAGQQGGFNFSAAPARVDIHYW